MLAKMAKSKKSAEPPTPPTPRSSSWLTSRQRRKYLRLGVWVLLPFSAAFLVALLFGTEEAPISTTDTHAAVTAEEEPEEQSDAPPPMDTWAKPSECMAWAGDGQCASNPKFMLEQCAWSCHKIELAQKRYNKRCPRPDNYTDALAPGQMSLTFARALKEFPELQPEQISADPPVILFHSFLSDAEVDSFVRHGKGRYEKSLGVGMKEDGTMGDLPTEIRTSSHGWCKHPECVGDPHVQSVITRVSNITQTPETNAEFAQLVYAAPTPPAPCPLPHPRPLAGIIMPAPTRPTQSAPSTASTTTTSKATQRSCRGCASTPCSRECHLLIPTSPCP